MSKELTPLEALWKLYTYDDLKSRNPIAYLLEQENLSKYYKTIEKALKRLVIIDKLNEKHYEETQKKLKALEIIKEKNVFVWGFINRIKEIGIEELTYKFYKKYIGWFHSGYNCESLTEAEFDLLKEVLK